MNKGLLYYICFLGVVLTTNQSKALRFRTLSVSDGFPSKTVTAMAEDSIGFMWFGTYEGLVRYDGEGYRLYTQEESDSSSLISSNVESVLVTSTNELWLGGCSGFSIYNYDKDNFFRYRHLLLNEKSIHTMLEDDEGNVWIGTSKGVLKYNTAIDSLSLIHKGIDVLSMSSGDGFVVVGTEKRGALVFDSESDSLMTSLNYDNYRNFFDEDYSVFGVDVDASNHIWLTTYQGGVYKYNVPNDELIQFDVEWDGQVSPNLFSIEWISPDQVLIGTLNDGAIELNPLNNTYLSHKASRNNALSVVSNTIRCILQTEDLVWLGSHMGGVCYFHKADFAIDYFNSLDKGFDYDIVSSFAEDSIGNIWIGTDGGGLIMLDPQTNQFSKSITRSSGLLAENVTDLSFDGQGRLWCSVWGGTVSHIDPEKEQVVQNLSLVDLKDPYSAGHFKGLFFDSQSRLWTFPLFSSLSIYETQNDEVLNVRNHSGYSDSLFQSYMFVDAVEDLNGNVWLYGLEKLGRVDANGFFHLYQHTSPTGVITDVDNSVFLFVDSRNTVWLSRVDGISVYDSTKDEFVSLPDSVNFPNRVYGMLEDDHQNIWMVSDRGIVSFNTQANDLKFYEKNIGISNEEYIDRSCFKSRNGTMYFGSTSGFVKFHPDSLKQNRTLSNVLVTELDVVGNHPFEESTKEVLQGITLNDETIVLTYDQNSFSFHFVTTSFVSSSRNQYSFMLEGFDDSWSKPTTLKTAIYTNLDPGDYVFKVKASNNEGLWNHKASEVYITVLTPWWMTTWFRICLALSFAIGTYLFYRYRVHKLEKYNKKLAFEVDKKTKELQKRTVEVEDQHEKIVAQKKELEGKNARLVELNSTKDKFFSIISHDLRNPVSVLMGFSGMLSTKKDLSEKKRQKYAEAINTASHNIFNLLENLLEWSRSQTNSIKLEPEKADIKEIVLNTQNLVHINAAKKNIIIQNLIPEDIKGYFDVMVISTVFRNLLSNAIKYSNADTEILIDLYEKTPFSITISVRDSGVGIDKKKIEKIFSIGDVKSSEGTGSERGTGLGLILCKEFVSLHKGAIWAKSRLGVGSVFYVKLPLLQSPELFQDKNESNP